MSDSGPDSIKLPFAFDPARLREDLARLDDAAWIEHFVKQNFDGDWSVIPLRGRAGATHPVMMISASPDCREFESTPFLDGLDYMSRVLEEFQCDLRTVRLMKLTPGSVIKEHQDHDLSMEHGFARLHIPVRTNPDVEFMLNGKQLDLKEGECWYLRLSLPHSVVNRGDEDRVHLVVDAFVNDWLQEKMGQSSAAISGQSK